MPRKKQPVPKLEIPPDRVRVHVANGTRIMIYTEPDIIELLNENRKLREESYTPLPMVLHCPMCCTRHIDEGEFETKRHHTHACQSCGFVWRPAVKDTVGVRFLPGFKNTEKPDAEPGQGSSGGSASMGG